MDPALWLLLRLRLTGYLRRWGRNLRSIKGLLLTLVGSLLFLPMVLTSVLAPRVQMTAQLGLIRRYGPLGMLAFCLLNLLLTSDERAIYFTPAEVEFLFSGPLRRRELLIYKMVGGLFSSVLTAAFMTLIFAHHANSILPAFVGLFLTIELLVLISMATGLFISTVGALAYNRQRKILLVAVAGVLIAVLLPKGKEVFSAPGMELLSRLEHSSVLRVLAWPFRPAIMAFATEQLWPELAVWSFLGLAPLATLAIAIMALDTEYYEATASASAKTYARLRAARSGTRASRAYGTRFALPMLPWWGGSGPALWRQLTTAARHPDRFLLLVFLFLCPLPVFLFTAHSTAAAQLDVRFALMMTSLSLAASLTVGFDFRSDVDRMDTLKSLPIVATALVIGELVVPVLMLTLAQAVSLILVVVMRGSANYLLDSFFIMPLLNAQMVEIDAILFLWFPVRIVPGSAMDFSIMGRQFLLMFAKLMVLGFSAGVAAGIGALVYYLVSSWTAAVAVTWITMAGFVVSMVPLVVAAFHQYDVARDCPP